MVVEGLFRVAGRTSTNRGASTGIVGPTTRTIHSGDVDSNDVDQSRQRLVSNWKRLPAPTHRSVLER